MKKISDKNASINLSTSFLVILILSLVVLGLTIPFLKNISSHGLNLIEQNQQQVNEFFRMANCKDDETFCVYPNVINPLNKEKTISAVLVNTLDLGTHTKIPFKLKYEIINISGLPNECVKILPQNDYNFSMYPNSKIKLNFILRPNGSGSCLLKINVYYKTTSWQLYRSKNVYVYK